MKWVVYEVWTTARVIEAKDEADAHAKGEPEPREGLNLSNWHVIPLSADDPKPGAGQTMRQTSKWG